MTLCGAAAVSVALAICIADFVVGRVEQDQTLTGLGNRSVDDVVGWFGFV